MQTALHFNPSEQLTLGVEIELQILNLGTRRLNETGPRRCHSSS